MNKLTKALRKVVGIHKGDLPRLVDEYKKLSKDMKGYADSAWVDSPTEREAFEKLSQFLVKVSEALEFANEAPEDESQWQQLRDLVKL